MAGSPASAIPWRPAPRLTPLPAAAPASVSSPRSVRRLAPLPAAVLLSACLYGCSPGPILKYETSDPSDQWESGTRLHPAEAGGMACTTWFEGDGNGPVRAYASGRTLGFGIHLRNRGDTPVRVDPAAFRVVSPRLGLAWSAADPEAALEDVEKRRRANEDNHATYSCLTGVGTMLSLTAGIASIGDARAQEEIRRSDAQSEENAREEREGYESRARELESERSVWADGHLRRTDMHPGRSMSGALTFRFPEMTPPDTLVLQWLAPGGRQYDLGRYGRPRIAADTARPPDPFRYRSPGATPSP